jgi:hypothetical protein
MLDNEIGYTLFLQNRRLLFHASILTCIIENFQLQSSKWKLKFTGPNQILEFILHIHVYLNKNWKTYWSEQSFTGLGPEDRTKFYWSWTGGPVLIMRTEQSFTGLGPEDRCSSWGSSGPRPVKLCSVLMMSTSPLVQDQ